MNQDKTLKELMDEVGVPDYVTVEQAKRMIVAMDKGQIHPNKGACDMTLEIAVGVPILTAISTYRLKSNAPSIYQELFDRYMSNSPKTL